MINKMKSSLKTENRNQKSEIRNQKYLTIQKLGYNQGLVF